MESSQDGNYPITIDEAVDYFGVNPNSHAVTTQSMKLTKQPVLQLKNITVRYRTLVKAKKIGVKFAFCYFLQRRSSGSCWK